MGYTHYWFRTVPNEPADAYGKLALDAKRIVEAAQALGLDLAGGLGEGEPDISEGRIWLNGRALAGDHETFLWSADLLGELAEDVAWARFHQPSSIGIWVHQLSNAAAGQPHFAFCKTARKPYDAVVCAILIRAKLHYGDSIAISSDGSFDLEWTHGAGDCWADEHVAQGRHGLSAVDLCLSLWPDETPADPFTYEEV